MEAQGRNNANEVVYNQPAEVDSSQEEESSDVQPEDQNTDQEKQTSEARNLPTASETESEQYQRKFRPIQRMHSNLI